MAMKADQLERYRGAYVNSARATKREILEEVCQRSGWSLSYARKKILYPRSVPGARSHDPAQRTVFLWQMFGAPSISLIREWAGFLIADPRSSDGFRSDLDASIKAISQLSDSTLHRHISLAKGRRATNPRDVVIRLDPDTGIARGKVSFVIQRHFGVPDAHGPAPHTVFFHDHSSGLTKARTLAIRNPGHLADYLKQMVRNTALLTNVITVECRSNLQHALRHELADTEHEFRFTDDELIPSIRADYSELTDYPGTRHRSELFLLNLLWDEYDRLRNIFFPRYRLRIPELRGNLPSAASAVFISEQLARSMPDKVAKRKFYDYSKSDGFQILDRIFELRGKLTGESHHRLSSSVSSENDYANWKKTLSVSNR